MTIFVRLSLFEETSQNAAPQALQGFQHNLLQKNFSAKPQMKIISSPLHLLYPTWIHKIVPQIPVSKIDTQTSTPGIP